MSGLEILGAISAAVELGLFCHRSQKGLLQLRSDRDLSRQVLSECIGLIEEIDKRNMQLLPDHHPATSALRASLENIKSKIEQRKCRGKWIKGLTVLRPYGESDKKNITCALQRYQTQAILWGNEALYKILGLSQSLKGQLREAVEQISDNLSVIATGSLDVKREVVTLNSGVVGLGESMDNATTMIQRATKQMESTNLRLESLSHEMMKEIRALRVQSVCPAIGLISRKSDMDRARIDLKLDSLNEYLSKLRSGGGTLSDLEIWELAWDFVEIYREFGASVVNMIEEGALSD